MSSTAAVPSPSVMEKFAPKPPVDEPVAETPTVTVVLADLDPMQPGQIVRPGLREQFVEVDHDGVIKAKQVKEGMVVRAFLHGKPCGGERTVSTVKRSEDGSMVHVEFSSPHPPTDYKAAYRFFVKALVGTKVRQRTVVPALVPYEEV